MRPQAHSSGLSTAEKDRLAATLHGSVQGHKPSFASSRNAMSPFLLLEGGEERQVAAAAAS